MPKLDVLASSSTNVDRLFVGVATASRFASVFTSGIFSPASVIFASIVVVIAGNVLIVLAQKIVTTAVWAGVILQAVRSHY